MAEAALARFIDRHTIEYVRTYPHPVERVWRAITDPAEFSVWFIRGSLDPKVGGAYEHTGEWEGVVLAIKPPRHIRFDNAANHGAGAWYDYRLEPAGAGTRMVFTQYCPPTFALPADAVVDGLSGADIPGGFDTPWYPGGLGGWHEFWDALGDFLDGAPIGASLPATPSSDLAASWARKREQSGEMTPRQAERMPLSFRRHERRLELIGVYTGHIRAAIPPARTDA